MSAEFVDAFEAWLRSECPSAVVRQVEHSRDAAALWARLEDSGFADALLPESAGGAGLTLAGAFGLWLAAGRHALPLPLAQTMLVRAALAAAGQGAPAGPATVATQHHVEADGGLLCPAVPFGAVAAWVALPWQGGWALLPTAAAEVRPTGVHGSLQAHLRWPAPPTPAQCLAAPLPWALLGATCTAALMAGALEQVLAASIRYANERVQFGKPIGKLQALQQQLAVLAEQSFAARMGAQLACASAGATLRPTAASSAAAKAVAGEAAQQGVAIAHAVHGAIGVTAAFDLQLHTRRLQEWRLDHGSAAYWQAQLGAAVLASSAPSTLHFVLAELSP